MNIHHEYEKQLLGRIISSPDDYYGNADIIHQNLFDAAKEAYIAYTDIIASGSHPSVIKMIGACPNEKQYIMDSLEEVDFSIPIKDLVDVLEENRKVNALKAAMLKASGEDTSEEMLKVLSSAVTTTYGESNSQLEHGYDIAKEVVDQMFSGKKTGVPTGVKYFDAMTGGAQPSDLIVIAAEPSQGKTSLALNIAQNMLDKDFPILIVSLEMSKQQLMTRMIATKAQTPVKELRNNYDLAENIAASYKNQGLVIAETSNSNIYNIIGVIRSARLRNDIRVVFIDYLQLVTNDKIKSREQEVGQISRALKNLAKELNIPIVILSQLNRVTPGSNPFPTMRRLRDSGQIEEAADIIWFIFRPEEYPNSGEWDGMPVEGLVIHSIAKGRNYGTGRFEGRFKGDITKFYNINEYESQINDSDNDTGPF